MNKKRIIIAAVTVAVLAAVYGILMLNPPEDKTTQDNAETITDFKSNEIKKISVVSKNGSEFTVEYGKNTSKMTGGEKGRYDENVMSQLRESAAGITGKLVDPSSQELQTYGLDDKAPVDKVTIKLKNKAQTLIFGVKSDALNGRYCRFEDNSDVYFISSDTADILTAPQKKYLLLQVLTSYYSLSSDMQSMSIDSLGGTEFAVERRDTSNMSKSETSAYSNYVITQPQSCAADDEKLNSGIFSHLQDGLTARSVKKTNASSSDLKKYGLDNPKARISLSFSNASATVLIGNNADKDTVYVMTEGGKTVFRCDADSFKFLDDDWQSYRSSKLIELALTQIKSVQYSSENSTHTIRLKSSDDKESKISGTLDNKKINSEHIQQMYSAIINLNYISQSNPVYSDKTKAVLKVTLTDGSQHTVKMIKGGSREYIADADGSGYIYIISKADFDALADVFKK